MDQTEQHPGTPSDTPSHSSPTTALSQPGPHGYPIRFAVRQAGPNGLKMYENDPKQPIRYIERHSRRIILHESAHKKHNSHALVTIHTSHFQPRSFFLVNKHYTITLHRVPPIAESSKDSNNANLDNANSHGDADPHNKSHSKDTFGLDKTIDMTYAGAGPGPGTFDFTFPVPTSSIDQEPSSMTPEVFEWRPASWNCHETRGIRKSTLPSIKTGDPRPPEEAFVLSPSGSILVRLQGKGCPPSAARPLGYTREGEEIVASYSMTRDKKALMYFQFWGSGVTGELGEEFTHVAVLTGMAVWLDEVKERRKRENEVVSNGVVHTDRHGPCTPGRAAEQCGM
ncbi:hypothetical protein VTI74DRAFT_7158 [Chaetomium olivicolor]